MKSFSHDVAISAVSYDSLLVAELSERLAMRLMTPLFWRAEKADVRPDVDGDVAAAEMMETSARVVVVLHQRLWGHDGLTAADASSLRERVRAKRHRSIRVVLLDDEPVPSWLSSAPSCAIRESGVDGAAEKIIAAIVSNGGEAHDARPKPVPEPAEPLPAWSQPPRTFMSEPRALTALRREFDTLTAELERRVKFEGARDGEKKFALHSAPQRLVVQLGAVGLSMSWVADRSGNLADGRLLVIEWEGAVAHGRSMGAGQTASPTRERVFRPEAKSPEDWCWRPEGGDGSAYSSRNLAGQYFASATMVRDV
ncbi:MAG TPA: hypothetical protein VK636_05375 [Gemmatimonadaceae bacterium]|nr:hypothetical protein [Gemmatimonadaceae bacterium]